MELTVGNAYRIMIDNWEDPIVGVIQSLKGEWVILSFNQVDYQFDGDILLNKQFIESGLRGKDEMFLEKTIVARGTDFGKLNVENLLSEIVQISLEEEEEAYIGKLLELKDDRLILKLMDTNGGWTDTEEFSVNEIRTIQVNNDYLQALFSVNEYDNRSSS